jgi:hypothetical protein
VYAVVRALLGLALLITLAMPFATALCMAMEHPGMTGASVPVTSEPAIQVGDPASTMAHPVVASSRHACCERQSGAPKVVTPSHRFVPDAPEALPAPAVDVAVYSGGKPPGWFDPAREKPDHLAPSLTALSVSRT